MPIRNWSTTPAQNNQAPPNGWPEGMPPSGVNDSARQGMADVRTALEDAPWLEYPDAITYVSGTSFTLPGDVRARYAVGRRIRVDVPSLSPLHGTISAANLGGGLTTVSVIWDAGALPNSTVIVSLGPSPAGKPVGLAAVAGIDGLATEAQVDAIAPPPGSVIAWLAEAPPDGYLSCDGAAVSRATYAALFSVIGTTWGAGNGTTTFNLPDFQRRSLFGMGGTGNASLGNTLGSVGGAETKTLTAANMPAHKHKAGVADNQSETWVYGGTTDDMPGSATQTNLGELATPTQQGFTSTEGGGAAFNILPPAGVIHWCVRWR